MFGLKRKMIGLFGTSGKTTWRQDIAIPIIQKAGIDYFNPQKSNWSEEDINIEFDHLMNDKVIIHVITHETSGFGSLAETGWIALGGILRGQKVGFYIQDGLKEMLNPSEKRARDLIKNHIKILKHKNIYLASTIEELVHWAVRQI